MEVEGSGEPRVVTKQEGEGLDLEKQGKRAVREQTGLRPELGRGAPRGLKNLWQRLAGEEAGMW